MPKDATKNVDRYKVRGGQLNEFDFHQNQGELAEKRATNLIPGKAAKDAKAKENNKEKRATQTAPARGASPKKLAARKAAKKK